MFDATKKKAFVYDAKTDYKFETFSKWIDVLGSRGYFKGKRSALVTVFLEPNPSSPNIASILRLLITDNTGKRAWLHVLRMCFRQSEKWRHETANLQGREYEK